MPDPTPVIIGHCDRCGVRCRVGTPDPAARLLRESAVPHGYCVNCAVTEFFKLGTHMWPLEDLWKGSGLDANKPGDVDKALRLPHIQAAFAEVLRVGKAQVNPADIDWLEVIANWNLPFDGKEWPHA
jgi:hypothetical protein